MRYDASRDVDAEAWLALDEQERTRLVTRFHKHAGVEMPSLTAHAAMHVTVEGQLAMGTSGVREALERLRAEGLDRHDAVHAIASVVAKHLYDMLKTKREFDSTRYEADLRDLTAESWRRDAAEGE